MTIRKRRQKTIWLAPLLSLIAVGGLWQLISVVFRPRWLPSLSTIFAKTWDLVASGTIAEAWITVTTLLVGLALVVIIAGLGALSFYIWPTLGKALEPMINAVMATPTIALIPAFALVWGYSDATRVVTIIAFALPPTILTWASGLRLAPVALNEMAMSFGASHGRVFRTVVLPSASPVLIGGLRLAIVQGIKGIVAAEMLTGVVGIGKLLIVASNAFDIADLYALVFVLVVVSCAVYLALRAVESKWGARA